MLDEREDANVQLRMVLLVAATGLLFTTGYAAAEDRMNTCDAIATQRGIKGDGREEFMKTCLSAGDETVAKPMNSENEKMKTCYADATAKNLKDADLDAFMKTCLSGK